MKEVQNSLQWKSNCTRNFGSYDEGDQGQARGGGSRVEQTKSWSPVIPPTPSSTQKAGFLGLNPVTGSACVARLILPNVSQMKRRKLFKNFIDKFENVSFQKVGWTSRFQLHQIANVDQTPLPFAFTNGPTYETTNSSTVWVRSASSGLDKRQCTVQLTIFADGKSRIKPLLIFRGTGKRIPLTEQLKYDKHVTVQFQPNAWCDEEAMERWIRTSWKPHVKEEILLVLDLHKTQKTDHVKQFLANAILLPFLFPLPVQISFSLELDVSFNAPFKKKVESAALQHIQDNLDGYLSLPLERDVSC